MSEPFVAEIKMFAGNFAPVGYALCQGQLMPIQQNTALFSLIGTFYGGNGTSTFGLPDLRGRYPMNQGQGPGLTDRVIGENAGEENVALLTQEMAAHTHLPQASSQAGSQATLGTWSSSVGGRTPAPLYSSSVPNTQMNNSIISPAGGNLPHNNLQPYLVVTFIIALNGIFPSRN
jgi:microcystin-dependent protein